MLPLETILAFSPPSVKVCKLGFFQTLRLWPMTLAHVVALEAYGCDINDELSRSKSLIAAWVLSRPSKTFDLEIFNELKELEKSGLKRFLKKAMPKAEEIEAAVNRHLNLSFKTYVPSKESTKGRTVMSSGSVGYGWPLEIAEHLCGEYGWSFETAIHTPVARALALVSVGRIRLGGEAGGPDYYQRIDIRKLKECGFLGNAR